jgi:pimeloyl-ACP methyl ester carboxylesterase
VNIQNEQRVVVGFEGDQLSGVLTTPAVPTTAAALLLHGGPGGVKDGPSELYVRMATALAYAGIASARFDFLGAGESDGRYVKTSAAHQVSQYKTLVQWLDQSGFTRIGVVGESFGGTCALGGYQPDDVHALVLLWPAIWLFDGAFAPLIGDQQRAELADHGHCELEGVRVGQAFVDDLISNPDREDDLHRVKAPTLLVHGDADSAVPAQQSQRAHQILTVPKRLVVVPDAEHCLRRPHEQMLTLNETTRWLREHLLDQ